MMRLEDDGHCFVCGSKNPQGLRLSFSQAQGVVRARFIPGKSHQGYKDIVHGGIISAILDEAMIKAVMGSGSTPVTAEIKVRFRNVLMVGEEVVVEAKMEKADKLIETSAVLRKVSDGMLIASGTAKFLIH